MIPILPIINHRRMISIIVPSYGPSSHLDTCLASIQDTTRMDHEVIVVNTSPTTLNVPSWVRIVQSPKNGFATAINAGMKAAQGGFLLWLNNDVVLPHSWDEDMTSAFGRAHSIVPHTVGFVGPVSNAVGGPQKTLADYKMHFNFVDASPHRNFNRHTFAHSYFLSGFCLMMTRAAADAVGPVDTVFEENAFGGFEDSDYIRRGAQLGFDAVIAREVFVHHEMSATFKKVRPQDDQGRVNGQKFAQKWGKHPPKWTMQWKTVSPQIN